MGNYKVRVNSQAESKEAQELFQKLIGKENGFITIDKSIRWVVLYQGHVVQYEFLPSVEFNEITLPELRAMVNPSLNDQYLEQRKKINDACASVFKKQDDLLTAMINHSSVSINDQYAEIEQVRQAIKVPDGNDSNHALDAMSYGFMGIKQENVNHPSHYTQGKVECIDALESATIGKSGIEAVCVANVIKYLWRYEEKNGLEDVKKAQWYLERLVASMGS